MKPYALLRSFFPSKEQDRRYSTQRDMLEGTGINRGVCQPLSNTWLESQIDGTESGFLADKKETLARVLAVNDAQREMGETGQDYRNYAFLKTSTPYVKLEIPALTLTDPARITDVLGEHKFALLTYRTKSGGPRHTVALRNERHETGKCKLFDPDLAGGEVKGPCDPLVKLLALRVAQTANLREKAEPASLSLSEVKGPSL